jgi:hypothetical protein
MKKQIRQSVFETNSSSTHTISISMSDEYKSVLEKMSGEGIASTSGQFGWEYDIYGDTWDKASYLWTGIIVSDCFTKDQVDKIEDNIKTVLGEYGIVPTFEPYKEDSYELKDGTVRHYLTFEHFAYIDHSEGLVEWLGSLFPNDGQDIDEELLLEYLFNPNSCVFTGNDNSDAPDEYFEKSEAYNTDNNIEFNKGN